jgi:hypothetical protein
MTIRRNAFWPRRPPRAKPTADAAETCLASSGALTITAGVSTTASSIPADFGVKEASVAAQFKHDFNAYEFPRRAARDR